MLSPNKPPDSLGSEIADALHPPFRTQKQTSNFWHIKRSLACTIPDKKMLVCRYPMRANPALWNSYNDNMTRRAIYADLDGNNLYPFHPGFDRIYKNLLQTPHRGINI